MASGKASKEGRNRRAFERLPLSVPVFIRGVDEFGRKYIEFSTSVDISAGGLLVAMHRFLPVGSKVVIEIPVATTQGMEAIKAGSPRNTISAKAIRSHSHQRGQLVALKFHRPMCEAAPTKAAAKAKAKAKSKTVS